MKTYIKIQLIIIVVILISKFNAAFGQATTNNNPATGAFLGWYTTTGNDLNFGFGDPYLQYMQLNGTSNLGFFGIGVNYTPSTILDIAQTAVNNAYGINGQTVLQNWGTNNIFCGVGAGFSTNNMSSINNNNSFFGVDAGYSNVYGWDNTFIGHVAGYSNYYLIDGQYYDGFINTFVGDSCGYSNTNGIGNSFVGASAGFFNSTDHQGGDWNTFMGRWAGYHNDTGSFNTFYGKEAGFSNVGGNANTYIGAHCAQIITDGDSNVYIGMFCGRNSVAGKGNVFEGISSGYNNSGSNNAFLGFESGWTNTTGQYNTTIGSNADVGVDNLTNASAIGHGAIVANSNQMIIGNNSVANVGIGYSGNSNLPTGLLSVSAAHGVNASQYVEGINSMTKGGAISYGINSAASNGFVSNIGVYTVAGENNNPFGINLGNYGIYSKGPSSCVDGSNCYNAAGYFDGDVFTTANTYFTSDSAFKDSIQSLTNAMSIINQLSPKSYYFKVDSFPTISLPSGKQYGLISQQVGTLLPELVQSFVEPQPMDSLGVVDTIAAPISMLGLNYTGLIPFVIQGEKELDLSIDTLRTRSLAAWNAMGNAGTDPIINILGTTDSTSLNIATAGVSRIHIDSLGNVGIGTNVPTAKFSVNEQIPGANVTDPTTAGYFHNGDSIVTSSGINETGISSIADGTHITTGGQGLNVGGYFEAENSNTGNVGVWAQSGNQQQTATIGYGGIFTTNGSYSMGEYGMIDMVSVDSGNTSGVLIGLSSFEPVVGSVGTIVGISNEAAILGSINGDATGVFSDIELLGTIGGNAYGVNATVDGNITGNSTGVIANMNGTIGGNLNGVDIEMPPGGGGGGLQQSIQAGGGGSDFLQQSLQAGGLGSNFLPQSLSSGGGLGSAMDTSQGIINGVNMNIYAYAAGGFNGENINITGNTPASTTGDNVTLNTNTSWGSYGLNQNIYDGSADAYGINSYVQAQGEGQGAGDAFGAVVNVNGSADSYGGQFYAYGAPGDNVGLNGYSDGSGSGANYGVYGFAPVGSCADSSCIEAAGFFDGDLAYTGTAYQVSDAAMKDSIQPLQNAMAILNKLNAKTYTFKKNEYRSVNLPSGTQDGFIAQEVETVLPGLVKSFKVLAPPDTSKHAPKGGAKNANVMGVATASSGSAQNKTKEEVQVKALNYTGLIPLLVEGMKEQEQTIDSLRNQTTQQQNANQNIQNSFDSLRNIVSQLQTVVTNCCNNNSNNNTGSNNSIPTGGNTNSTTVQLSNLSAIILNQNDPNPFAEHTTISYVIPASVNEAKIIFFDNSGSILKTVIISDRGAAQLDVYASNLSSGVYSYSLLADGNLVDTKKMVCTK